MVSASKLDPETPSVSLTFSMKLFLAWKLVSSNALVRANRVFQRRIYTPQLKPLDMELSSTLIFVVTLLRIISSVTMPCLTPKATLRSICCMPELVWRAFWKRPRHNMVSTLKLWSRTSLSRSYSITLPNETLLSNSTCSLTPWSLHSKTCSLITFVTTSTLWRMLLLTL